MDNMTLTAPERIYLQVGDGGESSETFPADREHITWCEYSVLEDEVQYMRADIYAAMVAKLREALQGIINATPEKWEELAEPEGEFSRWAKQRARYMIELLPNHPADPVKVDVQAIRNVIQKMRDVATFNHATAGDFKNWWADELDAAIGDRT